MGVMYRHIFSTTAWGQKNYSFNFFTALFTFIYSYNYTTNNIKCIYTYTYKNNNIADIYQTYRLHLR